MKFAGSFFRIVTGILFLIVLILGNLALVAR